MLSQSALPSSNINVRVRMNLPAEGKSTSPQPSKPGQLVGAASVPPPIFIVIEPGGPGFADAVLEARGMLHVLDEEGDRPVLAPVQLDGRLSDLASAIGHLDANVADT